MWQIPLIYVCSFLSAGLFLYASWRVLKEIRQIPIETEKGIFDIEETRVQASPLYKLVMRMVRMLAKVNSRWNLVGYENLLKRRLDAAGRPLDLKPLEFLAIKEVAALISLFCGILFYPALQAQFTFAPFIVVGAVILGFMLPNIILNNIIHKRQTDILVDLPFYCDLLTLSVEAGLDFGGALERVVGSGPAGPLAGELETVIQETKIGKTRREAFADLSERVQMQEVSNFAGAIIQADRMGAGFAPVLRIQSIQMRHSRFERAEKAAQKVPVKILVPIIIANVTCIIIILVAPMLQAVMGAV